MLSFPVWLWTQPLSKSGLELVILLPGITSLHHKNWLINIHGFIMTGFSETQWFTMYVALVVLVKKTLNKHLCSLAALFW